MEFKVTCPRAFTCEPPRTSFDIGRTPSYVSLVSSSLSCLGSLLILLAYARLKDMRTGAQTVITLLALADFFTAFGYIAGGVNFLAHFNVEDNSRCEVFENVCTIQSFVTTWSTMSSYCWTCILAFYFFLVIVHGRAQLATRLIPLYNVIAWVGPLTIMLPLLACGKLGFAPYVASNWCYISDNNYKISWQTIVFILIAGKLWEIMTYVFLLVIYIRIKIHIRKTRRHIKQIDPQSSNRPKVAQVEKRLLAIPLLYVLLRMWGTLQFFYSLAVSGYNDNGCIPRGIWCVFFILGILQAVGDGGQGWCNAILYVFLSSTMRRRLFVKPARGCLQVLGEKLDELLETDIRTRGEAQPIIRRQQYQESSEPYALGKDYGTSRYQPTAGCGNGATSRSLRTGAEAVMEVSLEQKSSGK